MRGAAGGNLKVILMYMTNHKVLVAVIVLACIFLYYITFAPGYDTGARQAKITETGKFLSMELKSYHDEQGSYPATFEEILNRAAQWSQYTDFKAEVAKDWHYVVSSDHQHFVASASVPGKIYRADSAGNPINRIEGVILGTNCSDPKTYCVTENSINKWGDY